MYKFFFLFENKLRPERLEWLSLLLKNFNIQDNTMKRHTEIMIFLSGESQYSLLDGRTRRIWMEILKNPQIKLYLDHAELKILGISVDLLRKYYHSKININLENFWESLIDKIMDDKFGSQMGVLQNDGPYMHRTTVYSIRLMQAAINREINVDYYGYLDGVHLGHKGQNPSEFENISQSLSDIKEIALKKDLNFSMLSCSRCGIARGYIRSQPTEEYFISDDTIPHYYFCNLNKIIDKFEKHHLILSSNSAILFNDFQGTNSKPGLIIFITNSPYASEWTFGGVSFAVASATHDIPTQVIFIEDGVYGLAGIHQIDESNKIFNLQDILEATTDIENLDFYAYKPSLHKRNIAISNRLKNVALIDNEDLNMNILKNNQKSLYHKRIMFF